MRARSSDPVAPYSKAMPYTMNPDENAPSRKYFSAASIERPRMRVRPVSTYRESENTSRPMSTMIRFVVWSIISMPARQNRISG